MIGIDKVLQHFDDTYDEANFNVKEYGLRFITEDGRVRTMRAKKKLKAPKQQLRKSTEERGKYKYNLQRHGNMLVEDLDLNEPRTVKPAMFFAFALVTSEAPKLKKLTNAHWQPIYH